MSEWSEIADGFRGKGVLVVGDVMLDEYVTGTVTRLCPDRRTQVLGVKTRSYAPGGAANVAANVAAMGGKPVLIGMTGQDWAADALGRALGAANVATSLLRVHPERPTTVKTRVNGTTGGLLRIDVDAPGRPEPVWNRSIEAAAVSWVEKCDVVIISDYGKGVIAPETARCIIRAARSGDIPILVDPSGTGFEMYKGCTLIKPNVAELNALTGNTSHLTEDVYNAVAALATKLNPTVVVTTGGADGIVVHQFRTGGKKLRAVRPELTIDPVGAGDSAAAAMALAMANKLSCWDVARLGNAAGHCAARRAGTVAVSLDELLSVATTFTQEYEDL